MNSGTLYILLCFIYPSAYTWSLDKRDGDGDGDGVVKCVMSIVPCR